jgi:hypothetical protein
MNGKPNAPKKNRPRSNSAKEVKNEKKTDESPKKSQCLQATTKTNSLTYAQRVMDYFFNEKCEYLDFLILLIIFKFILILTFLT